MSKEISIGIVGKLAIMFLRKKMPNLVSLDRAFDVGRAGDKHIAVAWEVNTADFAITYKDYSKQFIEPAVEALCTKMLEGNPLAIGEMLCGTLEMEVSVFPLNLPRSAFSGNSTIATYHGLELQADSGFGISDSGKFQPYFSITLAYTTGEFR